MRHSSGSIKSKEQRDLCREQIADCFGHLVELTYTRVVSIPLR